MNYPAIQRTAAEVEAAFDGQSVLQALEGADKGTPEIMAELERVDAEADSEFEALDLMGAFKLE